MTTTSTLTTLLADCSRLYADESASQEQYAAAVAAAQQALDRLANDISADAEDADVESPEEMGGGLYADYSITIELSHGGLRHVARTVKGWYVCGWIAPGASMDLDGSGLANWGSSQHGGWSYCDSDSANNGAITVKANDDALTLDIEGGYNHDSETIDLAALLDLSADDADLVREHLRVPSGLANKVQGAIDGAKRPVAEPSDEDIFAQLDEVDGLEGVRVGSYLCEDYVFAGIERDGEITIRQIEADDDMTAAMELTIGEIAVAAVRAELRRILRRRENR